MTFNAIINRWGNFYFFVQNLSEWHFSARKTYNELWRGELAPFSADEEEAVQQFREIRQKYKTAKTFFENAFFQQDDPFVALKDHLPPDEYAATKKIFLDLENKFEIIYNKDLPLLTHWQNELAPTLNDPATAEKIPVIIGKLFGVQATHQEVSVYLLLSAPNHTGGGANIDEKSISLEISRYPYGGINQSIGIVWHETIHLLFQNQYFYPLLLRSTNNDRSLADKIMEITAAVLFPRGILGARLLNNKPLEKLTPILSQQKTMKLLNIVKEYIDGGKEFDEAYIVKVVEIIKK